MGQLISGLFGGGGNNSAAADAAKAREQNRISLARNEQDAQNKELDTAATLSALRKTPRGRRLLIGDSAPGGLGTTVGSGA